jgi:hypothetical protein
MGNAFGGTLAHGVAEFRPGSTAFASQLALLPFGSVRRGHEFRDE